MIGGRVNSSNYSEIVVCTYTGWVFGLTTEPLNDYIESKTAFGQNEKPHLEIKVHELKYFIIFYFKIFYRSELDILEDQIQKRREKLQEKGQKASAQNEMLHIVEPFIINDKFSLRNDLACYILSLELTIPIDFVLLQVEKK